MTGSSPGGGLIRCFLLLPETGEAEWLSRLLCSPGIGERCPLLCEELGGGCVWGRLELFIRLTSSSVSSNWGAGSGPAPGAGQAVLEPQSGADWVDSVLMTLKVDKPCGLTDLFSASGSGCEPQMACLGTCSCAVVSLWLRLWLLHEITLGCVYFRVCTLGDRWRGGDGGPEGTVREGSARLSAEPL